jgi:hypothetical protein
LTAVFAAGFAVAALTALGLPVGGAKGERFAVAGFAVAFDATGFFGATLTAGFAAVLGVCAVAADASAATAAASKAATVITDVRRYTVLSSWNGRGSYRLPKHCAESGERSLLTVPESWESNMIRQLPLFGIIGFPCAVL